MNYSIHTYELVGQFKFEYWHQVCHIIKTHFPAIETRLPFNKKENYIEKYIYRQGHLPGITSITLCKTCGEKAVFKCFIYIRINPYNALNGNLHSNGEIIEANSIAQSNRIIAHQLHFLPKYILKNLTLNRVDFCVNLRFSDHISAIEYLQLLSRGLPRKCLHTGNEFTQSNSSILFSCKGYQFEIYVKADQMKNHRYLNTYEDYYGVIRFELRTYREKLIKLSLKYDHYFSYGDYSDFLTACPLIAKSEINKLVGEMVGYGNFYTYPHTKSVIENANIDPRPKSNVAYIVDALATNSTALTITRDNDISHRKWKRLLCYYDKLGISPITVPSAFSHVFYPGVDNWDSFFEIKKENPKTPAFPTDI